MSLAVLTLTRDRTAHLERLVDGLARSQEAPDELVVVRMGGEPVEPALGRAPFPVRVVDVERDDLPLAAARNVAAASTDADALVFLDVDCIPSPGLVGAYRRALPGVACGDVRYLVRGWGDDLDAASAPHPARPLTERREPLRPELLWSLSFAVDRASWGAIGGFDEGYVGYGAEDTDFGFAARAAGVPIHRIPGAVAYHQWHETFHPPVQHAASVVANARRFREKWDRWPMEGWLAAFEAAGLVRWDEHRLDLLRRPTAVELDAARRG